jgi:pilus assembly protein CpaD
MRTTDVFRTTLLGGLLFVMASCGHPPAPDDPVFADGAANHPITVGPTSRSIRVSATEEGITATDQGEFASFVSDYLGDGNGVLSISAPREEYSQSAVEALTGQLVRMGVPRSRILVGTRDSSGYDTRIELSYLTYAAHTDACGNWSHDADDTDDNLPMPDFGCSVQHNIAAMVAEPRDLVTPRPMGPADVTRRETIVQTYEKGAVTAAQKTQEQQGNVSDVASGQ